MPYLLFFVTGLITALIGINLPFDTGLSASGMGTELISSLLVWLVFLPAVLFVVRGSLKEMVLSVLLAIPLVVLTYSPPFVIGNEIARTLPFVYRELPYLLPLIPLVVLVSSIKLGYVARATAISYATMLLTILLLI